MNYDNIYLQYFILKLSPLIFASFQLLYKEALIISEKKNISNKLVFKYLLRNISELKKSKMQKELTKIKDNDYDIFDVLLKSAIKHHIKIYSNKNNIDLYKKIWNNLDPVYFLHCCYIETSKYIFKHMDIFIDMISKTDSKNKDLICSLIDKAIYVSVMKILPIKDILDEYLNNDLGDDLNNNDSIENVNILNANYNHDVNQSGQKNIIDQENNKINSINQQIN